jgi:hypothetical protein
MSAQPAPVRSGPAAAEAAAPALRVFVQCQPWVLALAAERVERLLLPEEVYLDRGDGVDAAAALGVVRVGSAAYPAWDLGLLLGLGPQREAWTLLTVPAPSGLLPLALRTGACLSALALAADALHFLPPALSRERPGLVTGAFATTPLRLAGRRVGPIGLALDVAKLLSDEQKAASAALLPDARAAEP